MGFGGAERVFLSVAKYLADTYQLEIHFVVDRVGKGETEGLIIASGFDLIGLASNSTLRSIFPLKKYLESHEPDILVSAYTDTNFGAIISAKLAKHRAKVIVSEHASLKEHWQFASFIRRLMLNIYVKFGYRFAEHILAVSHGIAKQLQKHGLPKEKVSCIHNPVRFIAEKSERCPAKATEAPTVLAVGRIAKQKNYLTLLQAFKLLREQQSAKLVIVGGVHEEAEKAKLDDFVNLNGLAKHVEFVGFTENVTQYYAAADVFVLSSAWEGFGNVIVEALAFGLPVVSTNCNHGPAEVLNDGQYGRLVLVGDSVAMAEAISEVLNNSLFEPSRQVERASDFSESKIGEEYYRLFQKVVKNK